MLFASIIVVLLIGLPIAIGTCLSNLILAFTIISAIALIIAQISFYFCQSTDIEMIAEFLEKKTIDKQLMEDLIEELKLYLTEIYPNYEKDIIKEVSANLKTSILITKYPEIKANETITNYVKELRKFKSGIAYWDKCCAERKRAIRIRQKTCKLYCLPIFPEIPESINL